MTNPSRATVETCPDCGRPDARTLGDMGCLARCPDIFYRSIAQCRVNTIARLRAELADAELRGKRVPKIEADELLMGRALDLLASLLEAIRGGATTGDCSALIEQNLSELRQEVLDELIALDDASETTFPVYRAVGILRAKYAEEKSDV